MRQLITVVIGLALIPARAISAQLSSQLSSGERIRVTTHDKVLVGTLAAQWKDSLQFHADITGGPITVARGDLQRLEVSDGRHSKVGTGAAAGAVIGLMLGGLSGQAAGKTTECPREDSTSCQAEAAAIGGLLGAALGAGLGAAIGSAVHGEEQWQTVAVDGVQ